MNRFLKGKKGSALVLSLAVMLLLVGLTAAMVPFINSQIRHSALNVNAVEAQYAAEAGAKRAIVGIVKSRKDWAWIGLPNPVANGSEATKYYVATISPAITDGAAPVGGTYTVTSTGTVNGFKKTVVATVKSGGSGSGEVFTYVIGANGNMVIHSGSRITGDVYSNGQIITTSGDKMVIGSAYYSSDQKGDAPKIENGNNVSGGAPQLIAAISFDIDALWPKLSSSGTAITTTWAPYGQWGGHTYPLVDVSSDSTKPDYYYNGNYDLNGHSYSIASGTSVTIFVNGNFTLMSGSSINGGDLTIYATGDVALNGGTLNNTTTKVYAGGNINLSSNSSITTNAGLVYAKGNIYINGIAAPKCLIVAGKNVTANSGSVVGGVYADGTVTVNGGTLNYDNAISQTLGLSAGDGSYAITWSGSS